MDIQKIDSHLREIIRETTTEAQWEEFIKVLTLELQGRVIATPDEELPKLKHNLTYLGELRNIFAQIFQKGK